MKQNNKEFLSVKLIAKGDSTITLTEVNLIETEHPFFNIKALINFKQEILLLKIRHSRTNTILDLTNATPYALLFFNENLEFCGASYSLNKEGASYMLQTEYKTILFVKHPNRLELTNINTLSYEAH